MLSARGTTLVELIVALTMLMIGLLGLIGTSTLVTRYLGQGRWQTVASAEATARLELLGELARSQGCGAVSGGSALLPQGISETWTVSGAGGVADLVVILSRPGAPPETLATTVGCR